MIRAFLASQIEETVHKLVELIAGTDPAKPSQMKLLFIPTAAMVEHSAEPDYVTSARDKFLELGFQVTDFDLRGKSKEDTAEALSQADIVFVGGGNTFYLLQEMRRTDFQSALEKELARGAIYAGSSAGSCVAGPDIGPIGLMDDPAAAPELKSTKGLGLVDFLVIPHYKRSDYGTLADQVLEKYGKDASMKPISDNQALWVEGDKVRQVENKQPLWF